MTLISKEETSAYLGHKLGRQLGSSTAQMVLSFVRAKGDYQVNMAVIQYSPDDPRFQGWQGNFYRDKSKLGQASQKIFLPKGYRGRNWTKADTDEIHHQGLKKRTVASWGSVAPMMIRLSTNIYFLNGEALDDTSGGSRMETAAIWIDTASVASQTASIGAFCAGQQMALKQAPQETVAGILGKSWKINSVGNSLQMGAGVLRLGLEYSHYLKTGEINNSTILYSMADTFGGASGVGWSHFVLKEAKNIAQAEKARKTVQIINGVNAQNHALLGVVDPPKRIKLGLKVANGTAAVVALGFNLYYFVEAATDEKLPKAMRKKRMISSGIGIGGAILFGASALMVGTALAPAVGVTVILGTGALIGQTLFDYFG